MLKTPSHHISLTANLILPCHLHLLHSSSLFPRAFPTKIIVISSLPKQNYAQLIDLNLITLTVFLGGNYKSCNSTRCYFLHSALTPPPPPTPRPKYVLLCRVTEQLVTAFVQREWFRYCQMCVCSGVGHKVTEGRDKSC